MLLLPRMVEEVDAAYIFDSTEERQTRLCFYQGLHSIEQFLPGYLQQALLEPLNARQATREVFPEAKSAEEASGEYIGKIHSVASHYILQAVGEQLIRHDRLLLPGEFSEGEVVTIRYKDGQGSA